MKTIYIVLLLLFPCAQFSSAAPLEKGHNIRIKIKGFKSDSLVHIGYYYGKNRYLAQDSARIDKEGILRFKGKDDLPEGVYICLLPKGYFEFLVTDQNFSLETDTADLELHMKVKGSKENTYFYEYRKYTQIQGRKADSLSKILKKRKNADSIKALKAELQGLDKQVDSFRKDFIAKYPGTFTVKLLKALPDPVVPPSPILKNGKKDSTFPYRYFKQHYFDNIDFSDGRLVKTPFYEVKLEYYFKNLVAPSPDSIIKDADSLIERSKASTDMFKYTLAWILNHYEESQYMGMDAVSSHLVEKYYLGGQTPWVSENTIENMRKRDSIVSHLLIGKIAPDLYLTDSNGKLIRLYTVHKKYTILYFWDATCGHCQHATPILHKFYENYKDSIGFEVYAATIERTTKDWLKYIKTNHIGDWINVWDSLRVTDFRKMYDVYSTPVVYILDANKKIIAKRLDVEQLKEFFENYEKREKLKP